MKTQYKQCVLAKKGPKLSQTTYQTSWIPIKFAVQGKTIKIHENEVWEDGWIVTDVGSEILTEDEVPDSHKAIKAHRKRTGDSLPKHG